MIELKRCMRIRLFVIGSGIWLAAAVAAAIAQQPAQRASCGDLQKLALPGIIVASSKEVPAGTRVNDKGPELPAHCLLRGEVNKHTAADGKSYGDMFELRLPNDWNGRLLFQGGGGLDGVVQPAVGSGSALERPALARGYAVVSTDGGHEADPRDPKSMGAFGSDPGALADYEYRSTRLVTDAAKAILVKYYGEKPKRSYFRGCSNGGREGLIAIQRYPQYFDGVIAGAPAFRLTRAMIAEAWNTMQYSAIAPRDAQGQPELRNALSETDLQLVSHAVLAKCDALDGVKDDLISNPEACHFDPATLQCPGEKMDSCLSAAQVTAMKKAMGGPVDSHGKALYSSWPYDSGISGDGWRAWILGSARTPSINTLIFPPAINDMALAGKQPPIDVMHFDFDKDAARLNKAAEVSLNAESTNLAAFRKHRGKLILYTGMSDPVFSANDLIRYYKAVTVANGGQKATYSFARLFLLPGINHCGGGPGLDSFDSLTALEDWVEDGTPPEHMILKGNAFPGRTRPMCPYPLTPIYNGWGNAENAASFSCGKMNLHENH
jgi:feruloyl esterase